MATSLTSTGVRFSDNSVQLSPALTGFRNRIINGDMRISQRGSSFANILSTYCIDRWLYSSVHTAVVNITQSTDVPAGSGLSNSLRATVATADTNIATGDYSIIGQPIEGYHVADLVGVPITISFWVRSSKTGIHCFRLRNLGGDKSYVTEYTISAINTWEKKSITLPNGLITSGTWNFTNNIGLYAQWALAVGSTFQISVASTTNAWLDANYFGTANQVNCLDTVGNIFAITGVQLEKSSVATDFEFRPVNVEYELCQRYYQTYITVVETSANFSTFAYSVPMRVAPTIAGGGAGFAINFSTTQSYNAYQTTRAGQTLTFSAEL